MAGSEVKDSIGKAIIARTDQGNKESEVTFGGEADLHKHLIDCTKNPGHEKFIPVKEFSMSKLPSQYHDPELLECIQVHSDLTVCLRVNQTSLGRPEKYKDSNKPYPFYNFRGSEFQRVGSGWVRRVGKQFKTLADNQKCPCSDCEKSSTPRFEWGELHVCTAAHVVFNTEEAKRTKCLLFYDSNDDKSSIQVLQGLEVENCNTDQDWCYLTCITHDMVLWERLNQMSSRCWELQKLVRDRYWPNRDQHRLTVAVSHPHGCSKQVSIGEWTFRHELEGGNTQYVYNTCTCPGSSGAPVILLGRKWWLYTEHPHSGRCEQDGLNMSSIGYDVD